MTDFDPSSFSNVNAIVTKHSQLQWQVDFDRKVISGHVIHTLLALQDTQVVVLDSSQLTIHDISANGSPLDFDVSPRDEKFGSKLTIHLQQVLEKGQQLLLKIAYETAPTASAVQWLDPAQTVGKKHPYLFTQCQPIHARSIVPCQDSPGVKITYEASVTVPNGLTALMSAIPQSNSGNTFHFKQPTTIPSYLIALVVGNLKGIKVGPRSTVWSEPESVEAGAWEFAETEKFIATGEALLTPYEWGTYDLLLLPSSFPYGGMENPNLTFVTPTLLAGDRSLTDVVAHEIAHSWMGNLVTTKNWEHFWLNEGFTVFIERKIVGRLHGSAAAGFSAMIGHRNLRNSIDHFDEIKKPEYTCLCPKLHGIDPDDVFSSVPYEKGFNLLYYLETILGGASVFEPYLKAHVQEFAHKAITTSDFKQFLYRFFEKDPSKKQILDTVDWDTWFNKPGMPIVENKFDDSLAVAAEELANAVAEQKPEIPYASFKGFKSGQKVMFFEKLRDKSLSNDKILATLDKEFDLPSVKNAEVKFVWFMLCLAAGYKTVLPQVVNFVTSVGRMKFVRPIYRSLNKVDPQLARDTFVKHRTFYHPICSAMVAKDLGL
ncbi:peptidase family M1-domain-containing protein [Gorgonomyces haynaldii]|nr:peptidase family M1-domain-containing protein [Gorgonomyces haynaldii]